METLLQEIRYALRMIGALVTLAIVAFIACYLPARRASLVNPIEALRTE